MNALAVLVRLARQQLDERRRELRAIDQAIAAVRERLVKLRREIEGERRAAGALTDGDLLLAPYERRVRAEEELLHAELGRLKRQREAGAGRLAEHHVEVRRLEILAERRAEASRAACRRQQEKAIDELALVRRYHQR
jgi:hypothetical protein